jgi:hypothetical protein
MEPWLNMNNSSIENSKLVKYIKKRAPISQIVEQFAEDQKYYDSLGPE